MNGVHAIISVAVIFLACACSVTWAECGAEVQPVVEECRKLVSTGTKDGTEPNPSCNVTKTIVDCYKKLEAQCEALTRDDTMYSRMKENLEKCAAPRPSIGFVLIVVSVMFMLLIVNRY